jgi:hypothetical protein
MPRRSTQSAPRSFPGVDAKLDDFMLLSDNTIWLRLTLDDETDVSLEFKPDSPLAHELLDVFGRATNERFVRLAQRGVTISGFTPPEDEGE